MQGRTLYLSEQEKSEYLQKFPQLPPEVIEGERPQSTTSDMYAVEEYFIALQKVAAFLPQFIGRHYCT